MTGRPASVGYPVNLVVAGRRCVVVGAGRIGLAVAQRAVAFGMRVSYVARSRHPEFETAAISGVRVDDASASNLFMDAGSAGSTWTTAAASPACSP